MYLQPVIAVFTLRMIYGKIHTNKPLWTNQIYFVIKNDLQNRSTIGVQFKNCFSIKTRNLIYIVFFICSLRIHPDGNKILNLREIRIST